MNARRTLLSLTLTALAGVAACSPPPYTWKQRQRDVDEARKLCERDPKLEYSCAKYGWHLVAELELQEARQVFVRSCASGATTACATANMLGAPKPLDRICGRSPHMCSVEILRTDRADPTLTARVLWVCSDERFEHSCLQLFWRSPRDAPTTRQWATAICASKDHAKACAKIAKLRWPDVELHRQLVASACALDSGENCWTLAKAELRSPDPTAAARARALASKACQLGHEVACDPFGNEVERARLAAECREPSRNHCHLLGRSVAADLMVPGATPPAAATAAPAPNAVAPAPSSVAPTTNP